jgi:uncharacterized iron-regulated membrane protein
MKPPRAVTVLFSFLRRVIQFVHLWTTFLAGAFILVVSLSGTLLLFRPELEPIVYHDLYRVSAGESLGLDRAVGSVQSAFPEYEIERIELPAMTHGAYRFRVSALGDGKNGEVFVDPATARVNGFIAEDTSVFEWLLALHKRLLISANYPAEQSYLGHTLVGLIGLAFALMLLTGLVLWWPKAKAWRQAFALRRKNAFLWNYDAHKLIGIATIIPLLAITSIILPHTFYNQANAALDSLHWPRGEETQVFAFPGDGAPKALDDLLRAAEGTMPGARAVRIKLGDPLQVTINATYDPSRGTGRYEGNATLYVDRYSAKVLGQTDTRAWRVAAQLVDGPMYMGIHAGSWGGLSTRVLEFLVGVGVAYMAWTGLRQWWMKRLKRRSRVKSVPVRTTPGV